MGKFLTSADVPEIDDPATADRRIADVEAEALRRVTALNDLAPSPVTMAIFRRIVMRWHIEGPAAVSTQTAVGFGVGFSEKRTGWKLSDEELDELRAIAGSSSADTAGLPRGSFPPGRIDNIFDPRSPSCT